MTTCTCNISKTPCNTVIVTKNGKAVGEYSMTVARNGLNLLTQSRPDIYEMNCSGKHLQNLNKRLKIDTKTS